MLETGLKFGKWLKRVFKRLPRVHTSLSVLRSWEQITRTSAMGAIGLSLLASGESINPWSMAFGAILLVSNTYLADTIGKHSKER
jgi:hypothetical protein